MKMNTMMAKMKSIRERAERVTPAPLKNVVGTALAAKPIIKSKLAIRQSNKDYGTLIQARKYKGMPLYDNSGMITDAFKAKSLVDEVRERLTKKK
jgi:hypothetical protein